jgi:hypothetical protein
VSKWYWIIIVLLCLALAALGVWLATRPPYALGCVPSPADALATAQQASAADVDVLPGEADMRAQFIPRSQGSQASCVGFAVSALLGNASPAFIYNQRTTSNCQRDGGMSLYNALAIVADKGDCAEALMPYITNDICTQPSDAALADALTRKVSGYSVLWGAQGTAPLDTIRGYLAAGTPVLVAVPVYQSLYADANKTIGVHADGERFYGGHAMLLVGYDADGFWALNSWGPDWGHDGFAYLSNEFVRQEAWEGWIINGLLGATSYSAYVHGECVDDDTGAHLSGVTVKLGTRSSTTNASGAWGLTLALTPDQLYTLEVQAPAGYWLPGGATFKAPAKAVTTLAVATLRFKWQATQTPTPTWTKTPTLAPTHTPFYPTATPTFTDPPTPPFTTPTVPMPPTAGPSPTKCVSAYQQFSWTERATIIHTGYTYIRGGLEDGLDMFEDTTLAIGNAQGFGAPLTRAYTVTGDQGEKIVCRGFAYAIVCQRTADPCGGEFGVVDWSGPMMTLAGGEWRAQ